MCPARAEPSLSSTTRRITRLALKGEQPQARPWPLDAPKPGGLFRVGAEDACRPFSRNKPALRLGLGAVGRGVSGASETLSPPCTTRRITRLALKVEQPRPVRGRSSPPSQAGYSAPALKRLAGGTNPPCPEGRGTPNRLWSLDAKAERGNRRLVVRARCGKVIPYGAQSHHLQSQPECLRH